MLIGIDPKTVRRERPPDHAEIREEMHEIAAMRRRFEDGDELKVLVLAVPKNSAPKLESLLAATGCTTQRHDIVWLRGGEMTLIGTIDPSWKEMSKYVVHFAKGANGKSAYDNAISILYERRIIAANAFGARRNLAPARKSVCFSEVPLHHLKRLADVRGQHGIGFRKEYIVDRGGGPILYAYKDTKQAKAINAMVKAAAHDASSPAWEVAPFVDLPGTYGKSKYLYEWEREWRHVGNLDFSETDPVFLIIPEDLHEAARGFFHSAKIDHLGPSYECPFIDPYWGEDQIASALYS